MHTIDLWNKALQHKRALDWAHDLGVSPSALTQAKKRGKLSPQLAGQIAVQLGEEPRDWIAVAAIEQMDDEVQQALKRACHYSSSLKRSTQRSGPTLASAALSSRPMA